MEMESELLKTHERILRETYSTLFTVIGDIGFCDLIYYGMRITSYKYSPLDKSIRTPIRPVTEQLLKGRICSSRDFLFRTKIFLVKKTFKK
jgi:hypothetical protein